MTQIKIGDTVRHTFFGWKGTVIEGPHKSPFGPKWLVKVDGGVDDMAKQIHLAVIGSHEITEKRQCVSNITSMGGHLIRQIENKNEAIIITRHNKPKAVMVSYELYQKLKGNYQQ